jgi:hypothetical protein
MRRGRIGTLVALLAIVALAVVASGCGGSAVALDPVAAAATKTQSAGAAHMTLSISFSSPKVASGRTLTLGGIGVVDNGSADLTFDLRSILAATGAPATAPSTLHEIALRKDGDTLLFMSAGDQALFGGKHWLELDISKVAKSAGLGALSSSQPGTQDPMQLLEFLKATGAKVQDLGSATVDGAPTTHYRATIDVASLLQKEAGSNPLLQQAAGAIGVKTLPEDVWVGKDGLLRRLRADFSLTANNVPLHLTMAMDLTDYGLSTTVTAPPADDTFDATSFLSTKLGSAGKLFG